MTLTEFLLARIAEDRKAKRRPALMLAVEQKMIERFQRGEGSARSIAVVASRYADHPDYREEWKP